MGSGIPDHPFVGVGAVVFRDRHVLLVQRGHAPQKGQWSLPGGRQELGETVRETARREVAEETGIAISPGPVVDVADLIERDASGRTTCHFTIVNILGTWVAGEPRAGDDACKAVWMPLEGIEALRLWPMTLHVILKCAPLNTQTPETTHNALK